MSEENVSWENARKVVDKRVDDGFAALYGSRKPDKVARRVLDAYHALYRTDDATVKSILKLSCLQNVFVFSDAYGLEGCRNVLKAKAEEYAEKDFAEIDADPYSISIDMIISR